jgi:hypothetical protein
VQTLFKTIKPSYRAFLPNQSNNKKKEEDYVAQYKVLIRSVRATCPDAGFESNVQFRKNANGKIITLPLHLQISEPYVR